MEAFGQKAAWLILPALRIFPISDIAQPTGDIMTANEQNYVFGKLTIGIGAVVMLIGRLFYPDAEAATFWCGLVMIIAGWFIIPKWPTPYNGGKL